MSEGQASAGRAASEHPRSRRRLRAPPHRARRGRGGGHAGHGLRLLPRRARGRDRARGHPPRGAPGPARAPRGAGGPGGPAGPGRARTRSSARSSAWATTTASPPPSSSATSWRTRAGTRSTRPTRPRSPRAAWRRCSTSRPWSPTSPPCPWPTPPSSTRPPPPPRPCTWRTPSTRSGRRAFFVAEDCHPQTIAVVKTRARPLGISVHVGPAAAADFAGQGLFGVLVQYPTTDGRVEDYAALVDAGPRRRRPRRAWPPTSWPSPC